ncbi:hypothetical protein D1007_53539 [Hordeum vulgare]|nr:hypothetical protein D1007_53539 [Hordeum vulgare]
MKFTLYDSAWDFYNTYARCAGFGIRKREKHKTNAYILCSREGMHKQSVPDYDRKRDKTSKRIGCKADIRLKQRKNGSFRIEEVALNHNHKMLEILGVLLHMHSHKTNDPLIDQLVKDMQLDNHTHTQMMSTLSRLSTGLQYMGHTCRDRVNKHEWTSAYYKEIFCILKKSYVREKHGLHLFVQQVDKCIQTRKAAEHEEPVANELEVKTMTQFGAEKCTAKPTKYLINHYRPGAFAWSRHEFQVVADEKNGVYECECKLWTHTGLFCVHVVCMLHHVRVYKIPEVYIKKRYTQSTRSNPTFDRRDYEQTTLDGSSLFCLRRLLSEAAMDVANRGTRSDAGYHRALSGLRSLAEEIDVLNEEEATANLKKQRISTLRVIQSK